MGMCYSLGGGGGAHPPIISYVPGGDGERERPSSEATKDELRAKEKADKKRSKSIDKSLKAEKRQYKQTHRLLLLGRNYIQLLQHI